MQLTDYFSDHGGLPLNGGVSIVVAWLFVVNSSVCVCVCVCVCVLCWFLV